MRQYQQLGHPNKIQKIQKTRKQMRKQKKMQKKAKKLHFFQTKNKNNHQLQTKQKKIFKDEAKIKISNKKDQKIINKNIKQQKIIKTKRIKTLQETQDDKMIKMYEKKLGLDTGKDKYDKIAKKFGFDDDLFDFLDGISKKTKQQNYSYKNNQQNQKQQQNQQQINIQNSNDYIDEQFDEQNEQYDEFDQMFDNLDDNNLAELGQMQQQQIQNKIQQQKPNKKIKQISKINQQQDKIKTENEGQKQIKKSMNSLLNKLSDGNILLTFRQFNQIIQNNPKAITMPLYAQLFVKFNLIIEKPLYHILATNIALLSALHYTYGNRLLGPVLYQLTKKYINLQKQQQNQIQVDQLGYSKKYQRLKNYTIIISLLYNYGSINGQFIESYVNYLTKNINKNNIQLIYQIIQKCGTKIRQNDPTVLKNIITIIKQSIQKYKNNTQADLYKISFIQNQLNDIRFNKKVQSTTDQRMAFLQTFLYKNVKNQIKKQIQAFTIIFQKIINIDTSYTNWWNGDNNQTQQQNQQDLQDKNADIIKISEQKKKLLQLAKIFHMVTQIKRNIFICIMDSKDYLQATQKILSLKVKNYQDVASVIVEICTLQPSFNPYYPILAAKLANLMPKFRMNLQYAIWDHLKLIQTYELRRTSNLAKFVAKLISEQMGNCSLSILKYYPDLSNVSSIDVIFLNIFFDYFFKKVNKQYLSKLVSKLRQDNNRDIKLGIKQYLSQFESESDKIKQKVKLCLRLLSIELDDRKIQRGNDLN